MKTFEAVHHYHFILVTCDGFKFQLVYIRTYANSNTMDICYLWR